MSVTIKSNITGYQMPALLYPSSALEPVISQKTIEFHFGKHLQAYVDSLNRLAHGNEYEKMGLREIVERLIYKLIFPPTYSINGIGIFIKINPAILAPKNVNNNQNLFFLNNSTLLIVFSIALHFNGNNFYTPKLSYLIL